MNMKQSGELLSACPEVFDTAFATFKTRFAELGFGPDDAIGPYGLVLRHAGTPYAVAWCYPPEGTRADVPGVTARDWNDGAYANLFASEVCQSCEVTVLGGIRQGMLCSDGYFFNDASTFTEVFEYIVRYAQGRLEHGPRYELALGPNPRAVADNTLALHLPQ